MAKINLSHAAISDLRSIFDYIATDSEFYARKVVDSILQRITHSSSSVTRMPRRGVCNAIIVPSTGAGVSEAFPCLIQKDRFITGRNSLVLVCGKNTLTKHLHRHTILA